MHTKRTPEERHELTKRAQELREQGMTLTKIALTMGAPEATVRHWIHAREREAGKEGKYKSREFYVIVEQLLREIPLDTRDLTCRLFGDPLPGRSALDMRETRGA